MFQIHTECIITESMSVCVKIVIKIKKKKIVIVRLCDMDQKKL